MHAYIAWSYNLTFRYGFPNLSPLFQIFEPLVYQAFEKSHFTKGRTILGILQILSS